MKTITRTHATRPATEPLTKTAAESATKSAAGSTMKPIAKLAGRLTATLALAALALLWSGCNILKDDATIVAPGGSGTVCYWIAADKDTYASFGRTGEEGDLTFGQHGTLAVAVGPVGRKRIYLHFARPNFPAGSEILFAKMELFHPGKNEDGSSDDIELGVASIRTEPWSPATLTWNNRPDRSTPHFEEFAIALRSQAWSGSGNIKSFIDDMFANPSAHYGFMIGLRDGFFANQIEKGFYANNDIRRKQNDLGLSPRLLLKVRLPAGKRINDVTMPFLPTDHDLGKLPMPVTMVRFAQSDGFPSDWNVSPNQ